MTGPGMDGPLVTVDRAAQILCCSRSRVYELLNEKKLTRAQSFGRRTVIATESVLALAAMAMPEQPAPPKRKPGRPRKSKSQVAEEARAAFRRVLEG